MDRRFISVEPGTISADSVTMPMNADSMSDVSAFVSVTLFSMHDDSDCASVDLDFISVDSGFHLW